MANRYITLANSNASLSKKFKVVMGSYQVSKRKTQSMQTTIGGKIDLGQGSVLTIHRYTLKVYGTGSAPSGYGDMANLETLFDLSDPGATPSDIITMPDHLGSEHSVYFLGELSKQPLAYLLDTSDARYMMTVEMVEIPS